MSLKDRFLKMVHSPSIRTLFVFSISVIFLVSCLATFLVVFYFNMLSSPSEVILICLVIGVALTAALSRRLTNTLTQLSHAQEEVAKGNFKVRLEPKKNANHIMRAVFRTSEVEQMIDSFNTMVEDLRRNEYLRKDFVRNVSHEFKTPITSIQGFTKLLKDENLPHQEFLRYTDIIIEETQRLANLSNNLLKMSQVENRTIPDQKCAFSLDEQLRKTILMLEKSWEEKNLQLEIDLDAVSYLGYRDLLQEVWINLLNNAIKFSNRGGTLGVTLHRKCKNIEVSISDNGIGISDTAQEHIFEQFYQADESRSHYGNGLGLAIAKRIVELSKGTISVQSKLGEGTTFTISLPVLPNNL
ncbi:HAMP domain-containing sensor histidine kinase [Hydrogenoanaerobacterium sp.]|uniref:HAMP domain-containing sensor histidine kinase n=1 Tax=Hydrogenoanaerobacterium sp. TaxID=2953763 RepID=UPI0028A2D2E9|nr:HAMP domain-containing sensor histidine kinase [Hydrogenoanaerobacterium sp.]